jgi:dipeptidyl aminopeptidase/acylaminoacyl peptidase
MRGVAAGVAAAWLALAGVCAHAAPLEAYGRLPMIEDVALSPDATRMAAITTDGDVRGVVIKNLATGAVEARTEAARTKIRSIDWAGNEHLLITTSATGLVLNATAPRSEYYQVSDLDLRDHKLYPLLKRVHDGANFVTGGPMPRMADGKLNVFVPGWGFALGDRYAHRALYKVDIDNHALEMAWIGRDTTNAYTIDDHGRVIAVTEYVARTNTWTLKVRQGDDWRVVTSLQPGYYMPYLDGVGRTEGTVIVREPTEDGAAFREISIEQATWAEPFGRIEGAGGPYWSKSHRLIGMGVLEGDTHRYDFYAESDQQRWRRISAVFPGQQVFSVSESETPGRLVVFVDSPTEGPAYAFVDLTMKTASWIGSEYPDLTPNDIAPVQSISFKAADGLGLSGYLTLPRGRKAQNLPLVVSVHDGPISRDTPYFDWWTQAIASRGYAVLRVNFRGSSGLGQVFQEAGFGELGRKMETDLSDGVRELARRGIVDPAKVCIVGRGYGGYAALAGAVLEPSAYKCVVSVNGYSSLRPPLSPTGASPVRNWLAKYSGGGRDGRAYDRISPVDHVDQVQAPILLIHGADDTVESPQQSRDMASALSHAHKSVQLEILEGEDHWLSRSATRLKALQATVAFLEKNNPPR